MLKVAEQAPAPFTVIKPEKSKLVERKSLPNPYPYVMSGPTCENSKKRWVRVWDTLTLAKIKVVLNDSIFSPVRRKPKLGNFQKGQSNSMTDMYACSSSRRQCSGNEWTDAFDALIRDPDGRLQFTKFLKSEYSEENILFWCAVEELHAIGRKEAEFVKTVWDIYKKFVAADSSLAINIDHDTRAEITERIEHRGTDSYTDDIFDKAQSHVYRLMEKDCFSRFVHTNAYKELSKRLKLPQTFRFGASL